MLLCLKYLIDLIKGRTANSKAGERMVRAGSQRINRKRRRVERRNKERKMREDAKDQSPRHTASQGVRSIERDIE